MESSSNEDVLCWIFDLDGTLIDNIIPLSNFFFETVPKKFGKKDLTQEQKDIMIAKAMEFVGGIKVSKWAFVKQFNWYGNRLGLNISEKFKLIKFIKENIREVLGKAELYPGTLEAITLLKNNHKDIIAINTSSSDHEIEYKFEGREELLKMFKPLVISRDAIENTKPHPESIQKISQMSGVPINRCIMVGDMTADIECGINAGACTIAVLGGFLDRNILENLKYKPDFIFESIADAVEHYSQIKNFIKTNLIK